MYTIFSLSLLNATQLTSIYGIKSLFTHIFIFLYLFLCSSNIHKKKNKHFVSSNNTHMYQLFTTSQNSVVIFVFQYNFPQKN